MYRAVQRLVVKVCHFSKMSNNFFCRQHIFQVDHIRQGKAIENMVEKIGLETPHILNIATFRSKLQQQQI